MTREQKLAVHLEMIIWQDLPEGTQLNASQMTELMIGASNGQRRRAYERALTHSPRLLEDEHTKAWETKLWDKGDQSRTRYYVRDAITGEAYEEAGLGVVTFGSKQEAQGVADKLNGVLGIDDRSKGDA